MRVSSATRPPSSGTFRSARTSTRTPATSAWRTERGTRTKPDRLAGPAPTNAVGRPAVPAKPAQPLGAAPPTRRLRGDGRRQRRADLRHQVDQAARVAPLVVVPAE